MDRERPTLGQSLGLELNSTLDVSLEWYSHEGTKGNNLYEILSANPVYVKDNAPTTVHHRFLQEDVPYGMVPMESLGKLGGVPTPVTSTIITLASELTQINFRSQARDLKTLGWERLGIQELKRLVDDGVN